MYLRLPNISISTLVRPSLRTTNEPGEYVLGCICYLCLYGVLVLQNLAVVTKVYKGH